MYKASHLFLLLFIISTTAFTQSLDDPFSKENMKKDLAIFKDIRLQANSGLYKYRTKAQIDSIYKWADNEINNSSTYLHFFNIISRLTDFEGSSHNRTNFPEKYWENLRKEDNGYFPYPIKWIDGKWIINFENGTLPLGAEIVSINQIPIEKIMNNLYQYYTTDGINKTGNRIGLHTHFPRYYRWYYGPTEIFEVEYREANTDQLKREKLNNVSSVNYYKNYIARYSKPYYQAYNQEKKDNIKYKYEQLNSSTGILTIHSFSMGNEKSKEHKVYCKFLDSVFINIKSKNIENLIVDIRRNTGGTDPNDLVSYSYLTQRTFQENTEAWISFKKIPYLKYVYTKVPRFLRPLGVIGYNRSFRKDFPEERNGNYYQDATSADHMIREPNKNAFTGNVYLLISPRVASAGSLFGALVAGNENSTVIGEETVGGYYGHNGHTPLGYILPNSKIETFFSVVNLAQDVPKKDNQFYNRGIMPDIDVTQTYDDFLKHEDTQMKYVVELIEKK